MNLKQRSAKHCLTNKSPSGLWRKTMDIKVIIDSILFAVVVVAIIAQVVTNIILFKFIYEFLEETSNPNRW